jgi:phosphatidylglycerophosphate synthase
VKYLTIPNCISAARLLAAPVLVVLAAWGYEPLFLGIALLLLLTDWVDGRIARAYGQETTFGARLDAFSDVAIYICITIGIGVLRTEQFWTERYWLAGIGGSYLLSLAVCLVKFRCLPNYHTRLSKISWLLVTVGVTAMLLDDSRWSMWPLRLAFAAVIAANFESIAVTLTLRRWRTDVSSLLEAVRRPEAPAPGGEPS